MTDPEAPEGTRLVRADGTELPLELAYTGYRHGTHQWDAVLIVALADGDAIALDRLPGNTAVNVVVRPTPDTPPPLIYP